MKTFIGEKLAREKKVCGKVCETEWEIHHRNVRRGENVEACPIHRPSSKGKKNSLSHGKIHQGNCCCVNCLLFFGETFSPAFAVQSSKANLLKLGFDFDFVHFALNKPFPRVLVTNFQA